MSTSTPNHDSDEGATPSELILESCRRNNVDLLLSTLSHLPTTTPPSTLLNTLTDPLGLTPLHVASHYGSFDVLDHLLDIENLEVDPVDRIDRETPLHKAVRYACSKDLEGGLEVVELLIDAGADPRIRNRWRQTPRDVVERGERCKVLGDVLGKAEYKAAAGDDVVVQDDEEEEGDGGSESE